MLSFSFSTYLLIWMKFSAAFPLTCAILSAHIRQEVKIGFFPAVCLYSFTHSCFFFLNEDKYGCSYMKMTLGVILFDFWFNYFTKNNVREAVLYCECVFYHVIYTCINQTTARIVTNRLIMCLDSSVSISCCGIVFLFDWNNAIPHGVMCFSLISCWFPAKLWFIRENTTEGEIKVISE